MAAYCSNLLTVDETGISLDTGLSPREAAQSKVTQYLKEPGFSARCDSTGTWQFQEWTWDDTRTAVPSGRKTESVCITGSAWNGVPLYSILEAAMKETASAEDLNRATVAVNLLNQAVESAATDSVQLPDCGPAAILCGTGENQGALLFLPAELFIRALQSRGDAEKSRYEGMWTNPVLSGIDAWRFTVASCSFAVLTGKPAYPALDTDKRKEDYLDKNHIPLTVCAAGQHTELLKAIEHNLDQQGAFSKKARKGKKTASDAIVERETVNTSYSVKMADLQPFTTRSVTDPATVETWIQYQKKIKRIRFVRKHQTALKIAAVAFVALIIVGVSVIRDMRDQPTTAGLTQDEVVEMYFSAIDTLDTTLFDAARSKKAGKGWSNYIATLFVTSKMRENYESIHTWTPGQWLYIKNPEKASVFGISNLQYEKIHSYDNDSAEYHATFYIIQLSMGGELTVSYYTTDLTVGKVKKNYRVIYDESEEVEIPVDLAAFLTDLTEAAAVAEDEDCRIETLISALRDTYPWMPSIQDANRGKLQLETDLR